MANKKIGRPTDNPMDTMLRVRVDKETLETLDNCAEKLNTTRSDVVRKGIHRIEDDLNSEK